MLCHAVHAVHVLCCRPKPAGGGVGGKVWVACVPLVFRSRHRLALGWATCWKVHDACSIREEMFVTQTPKATAAELQPNMPMGKSQRPD